MAPGGSSTGLVRLLTIHAIRQTVRSRRVLTSLSHVLGPQFMVGGWWWGSRSPATVVMVPPALCRLPPRLQSPPPNVTSTFLLETVGCTVLSRAGNRAAQPTSSSNPQPIPELPTEHVQEFKVVWSHKKKFHTVPVERARPQK